MVCSSNFGLLILGFRPHVHVETNWKSTLMIRECICTLMKAAKIRRSTNVRRNKLNYKSKEWRRKDGQKINELRIKNRRL